MRGDIVKRGFFFSLILFCSLPVWALDPSGRDETNGQIDYGPQGTNLQVLYTFDEASGDVVFDRASTLNPSAGSPLNLKIDSLSAISRGRQNGHGFLRLDVPTLVHSSGPASKIINACKSSNEITIEAWIKNKQQGQLQTARPLKILTLSNRSSDQNFYLGQEYMDGPLYSGAVRLGMRGTSALKTEGTERVLRADILQHVYFVRDSKGNARLYVSSDEGYPILREVSAGFTGDFRGWNDAMVLGLGNDISYQEPLNSKNAIPEGESLKVGTTTEQNPWLGSYFMVAIYCKALSTRDILGPRAPKPPIPVLKQRNFNIVVDEALKKAQFIYKRIVGVSTPLDNPVLSQMADKIRQNDLMGAAQIATDQSGFYNFTLKDFAKVMSTRDETTNTELNDFVATVIGAVRDNKNAKELLTGDFYYRGDPQKVAVPSNLIKDILISNRHYRELEKQQYDLKEVLIEDKQKMFSGDMNSPNAVAIPDVTAGLITTRAFMAAHAIAGTNRRLVQYSFREFLCAPISTWADSSGPDSFIGMDVDRFPGGSHNKFLTTCRSCHSVMDALRPAFARYNFTDSVGEGYVQYSFIDRNMDQDPPYIAAKMNRNSDVSPRGYRVSNTLFKNFVTRGTNKEYFGWKGVTREEQVLSGNNVNDFGRMLAESQAFKKCMVKRVFKSVCKKELTAEDKAYIESQASFFESSNYNLRRLFEKIITTKKCLGE
ncbi:MAG: DUF1585 domain-containing protein [Bdellovibrio sp.]|nr:MAG: DUF1585 domain-containing protein [Bdellovibrio sp.]